ncbi:competence/damage-inducible protein A [Tunicatimonas pelagia]|uniref:competence/damage-inducible protein A n=1 Tax=Tunicatimonas pelagia TaxID=931531 RepID=UPI0026654A28|nr:competence/damage-inducible protein A [Tunicatimonas pelagia]WKN42464.1 competence/damage-inducible protein A [Tunicatimonas pelagia]
MKAVWAEVITIGDEILYGQTLDTNTQWMGTQLNTIGVKIIRKVAVGDQQEEIIKALDAASQRADIILITGGLGPTKDDITKKTLADYFNTSLVTDEEVLEYIRDLFSKRNLPMNALNEAQALVPEGCTVITNSMGTAPGMWFEQDGRVYVSMPGVPYEMETMMEQSILPKLQLTFALPVIYHQMIQTVGIGESWLAEQIEFWEDALPSHIRLAYLPSFGRVKLRLTAEGIDRLQLEGEVAEQVKKVFPTIEKYIFGYGDITLEEAVGEILAKAGKTLAVAESCTGGFLAHTITSVPGCSRYFQGGVVAYSNQLKTNLLDVPEEVINQHGAVSEATVRAMAEGVKRNLQVDFSIATSGVAGPDGGTSDKPVGTIWIAVASPEETIAKKISLSKDRLVNVRRSTVIALNMLRMAIQTTLANHS